MINLEWKSVKLGEVITFQRGFDLPKSKRANGTIPIISSSGTDGFHNESKVKGPGVVTGRYGTLGKVFFVEEDFWPLNTTLYVKDFKGNDPKFISYFLVTLNLASQNTAGAVPGLNRNALHLINVEIPIIDVQQKIASILSSYDDLIENNTLRIEILEQMAKLVYEEWFVKFRFPGHENVKMVPSDLGEIPEGWEIRKIGDIFTVVLGGTPSRKRDDYWNGNIPWINSGKVNELRIINESEGITELGLKKSATKMMPVRTTVLAITGATLGQISLTEIEVCANQSVVGIYDEKKIYSEYIFLKIKEIIGEVILKAGGGAQQHINKEIVNETEVIVPPSNLTEDFNSAIKPIFNQISILLFKNQNLRKTRDLLLPKLISGEIDVSDLDIRIRNEVQES